MPTSRFLRSALLTKTITGATSVGGSVATTIALYSDNTIRFNDRNGATQVVPVPAQYVTEFKNRIQPSSGKVGQDAPDVALLSLLDALIART